VFSKRTYSVDSLCALKSLCRQKKYILVDTDIQITYVLLHLLCFLLLLFKMPVEPTKSLQREHVLGTLLVVNLRPAPAYEFLEVSQKISFSLVSFPARSRSLAVSRSLFLARALPLLTLSRSLPRFISFYLSLTLSLSRALSLPLLQIHM